MMRLMRMRVHLALFAIMVLLLPILAACGGQQADQGGSGNADGTGDTATAPVPPGELATGGTPSDTGETSAAPTRSAGGEGSLRVANPVSVEIYATVGSTEVGPPPKDWFWYDAVKKATNVDVKISWITDPSQYAPTLQTRAGANELPDLFATDRATLLQLVQQGLVADWAPAKQYMPSFVKERNVEGLAPIGTVDGVQYGLVAQNAYPYKGIVAIRQDWLDKLGLEQPETLDEYMKVMKAFTTQDPDGNGRNDTWGWSGLTGDNGEIEGFDPFFGAFGAMVDWKIEDNQVVPLMTSEGRRQGLEFINRMVKEGVVDPDWRTQTGEDYENKWKTGKVGIFAFDWCATYCRQGYEEFAKANRNGVLVNIQPPKGPNGDSAAGTYSRVGPMYVMSKKAADAGKGEAIARVLEWMTTDGYYLTSFGQEGVHWKRDAEGQIVPGPKPYLDPENLVLTQLRGYAYKGSEEELRARYDNTFKAANGQRISVWSIYQGALKLPKVDVTEQAVIPPAPPEVAADLTRTMAEAQLQFAIGQRPFPDWENYVNQINGMGLEQWTQQANEAAAEAGVIQK